MLSFNQQVNTLQIKAAFHEKRCSISCKTTQHFMQNDAAFHAKRRSISSKTTQHFVQKNAVVLRFEKCMFTCRKEVSFNSPSQSIANESSYDQFSVMR
jgi:hypothetical protein